MLKVGPAGIAPVDRRVDLQEPVIGAVADVAALGRDNAGGHGAAKAVRIADRHHPVADSRHLLGETHERVVAGLVDLDHGDVGLRVGADDLGVEGLAVIHSHGDGLGVLHHMIVGDDVAVGGNEEARALADHRLRLLLHAAVHSAGPAEALEELLDFRRQVVHLDAVVLG